MISLPYELSDILIDVLKKNDIDSDTARKIKREVNEKLRYKDIPKNTFFGLLVRAFNGIAAAADYTGKGTFIGAQDVSRIIEEKPGFLHCYFYVTDSPKIDDMKEAILALDFVTDCSVSNLSMHASGRRVVYPVTIKVNFDEEKMKAFLSDHL